MPKEGLLKSFQYYTDPPASDFLIGAFLLLIGTFLIGHGVRRTYPRAAFWSGLGLMTSPLWGLFAFFGYEAVAPDEWGNASSELVVTLALIVPALATIPILLTEKIPLFVSIPIVPVYYVGCLVIIFVLGWWLAL